MVFEKTVWQRILPNAHLTKKQSAIIDEVVKGLTNAQIAEHLCVAEKTVKFHLTNIYKNTGFKSRAQLTVFCLKYVDKV